MEVDRPCNDIERLGQNGSMPIGVQKTKILQVGIQIAHEFVDGDQAQQLERKVGDDVAKAMQQSAAGRAEAEK